MWTEDWVHLRFGIFVTSCLRSFSKSQTEANLTPEAPCYILSSITKNVSLKRIFGTINSTSYLS